MIVLFSKICWVIPLIVFCDRFTSQVTRLILDKYDEKLFKKFPEYEEIMKDLGMFEETPESLWLANK